MIVVKDTSNCHKLAEKYFIICKKKSKKQTIYKSTTYIAI